MEKNKSLSPSAESPFFDLLADADEIKIREIRPENRQKISSTVVKSLEEIDGDLTDAHRTFFVRIKVRPAPPPQETPDNGTNTENRLYLLKSADLLLSDSDFVLARNIYSYLLKVNIRDCEAMKGLGLCFLKLGDTTSAKKCFRALIELNDKEETFLWLGQCYVNDGDDASAVENFLKVQSPSLLSRDDQFELYKELGNCENRRSNFDKAWSHYHAAMAIQPSSDTIYVNLGTLEIQRQHPEVALSYFSKATALNPRNSRAHCGIGLVAVAREDAASAVRAFEAALDLDSQNTMALYQLVALASRKDHYAAVKVRLFTFLAKDPKHLEMRYALAVMFFKEGDWTSCQREVEAILISDPSHLKARGLKEDLNSNKHLPS